MPFELLKGTTMGWIPEEHGFSQREVKDTIRRIQQLMVDLDALWKRKEKKLASRKTHITNILTPNDWVCGYDYKKKKDKELYDITSHLALDKAVLEIELPYVEAALEHVPEETPPMRHEDYYKRLKKIESRRGEYWRINPTFLTDEDRRAGIPRRTPEQQKYWPTHQVPWKQGAPSPQPPSPPKEKIKKVSKQCSSPSTQTPSSTETKPTSRTKSSSKEASTPRVKKTPKSTHRTPNYQYYTPKETLVESWSSPDLSFLDDGPIFTPPAEYAETTQKDLKDLSEVVDELDTLAVQLMKVKFLAHESVGSPGVAEEQQPPGGSEEQLQCPVAEAEPECLVEEEQPQCPVAEEDPQDQSPGLICPEIIASEAFSPEQLGVDEMLIMMDDIVQRQTAAEFIDPHQLHHDAFSPEVLDEDTMDIIMEDAVQRHTAAELLDPHQLECEAFSPQQLDVETMDRMLTKPGQPTGLLSPGAQEGLRLLKCESRIPREITSKYGFTRTEKWNERLGRWKKDEEKQREEDRLREKRMMDAQAVFKVRQRSISAPPPAQCYEPETLAWGESPVDHISPPPTKMVWQRPEKSRGKGKKLAPIKRKSPHGEDPYTTMPPSRLLYPKTKGGPTVSQPERPSTSKTIFNTKRREYVHLEKKWAFHRDPSMTRFLLDKHREKYEEMLKPAPPILPPKPATPPPPPPPEYGPEPEHLSVYVPESVYESPATLKQRIDEAIARFENKIEQVRQRLAPRITYSEVSPWAQGEYMDPKPSFFQRQQMKDTKGEEERMAKWKAFFVTKYGANVRFHRKYKHIQLPRTASTYRPCLPTPPPLPKKGPVNKPYDEPLYGPWLPLVAGSSRPPPRTAAGRISSPYEPAPKPVVRRPVETPPPMPCPPPRKSTPQPQPPQVLYGSSRAPPKTAASYKYQLETPPGRPMRSSKALPRRRLIPSTPEMLYGSARAPPRTAASARSQTFTECAQTPPRQPGCPPDSDPDPIRSAPVCTPDISQDLIEEMLHCDERIERVKIQLSPVVDNLSTEMRKVVQCGLEKHKQVSCRLKDFVESITSPSS